MSATRRSSGLVRLVYALLCVALASGAAGECAAAPKSVANAQPTPAPASPASPPAATQPELSREQAVALVQKRYGARVVRAEFLDQEGRHVYVFRLLSAAGRVWIVRVNARTGTEVPE